MLDNICELPDGYAPSDDENFMNPMQREYFRRLLIEWKQDIISNTDGVLRYLQEETNPGRDFGDRAIIEIDVMCELKSSSRANKLLNKIDSALLKISNGTYGYCEETGKPIGLKRLIARPIATLCIEAQNLHEQKEKNQRN